MRRTGKTTRLINETIEYLFQNKEIVLYVGSRSNKSDFVDEDHEPGNYAQANFVKRLLRRIDNEHKDTYKIESLPHGVRITSLMKY